MITVNQFSDERLGACVEVTNGKITAKATLDVGPRIFYFAANGGNNVFFEDVNDTGNANEQQALSQEVYGDRGVWHLYGGHRLWASPESAPRTIYPDNQPVACEMTGRGVKLTAQKQVWTNLQMEMEIVMYDNSNTLDVYHRIQNQGAWDIKFAPWCLSVMAGGGVEIMPLPDAQTGLLPNHWLALWPYCKMNDPRVTFGEAFITLAQDTACSHPFKLGLKSQHGWAAYYNAGTLFVKYFDPKYAQGNFPDGGMNYETYTNNVMVEMESLGEYQLIAPGGVSEVKETWKVIDGLKKPDFSDAGLQAFRAAYIQ